MEGRYGQDGSPHPELRRVIYIMQARYSMVLLSAWTEVS